MTTTKQVKKTQLEVKVLSINTLYEYAAKILEYERPHFAQFVGKNIFKVDGSIKQKYEHDKLTFKGNLPDGTYYDIHYWFNVGHGYFDVNIKSCVNGGSYEDKTSTAFCQYDTTIQTLFRLVDNTLLPTDAELEKQQIAQLEKRYTVSELLEAKKEVERMAQLYNSAASKIPHMFKDTMYIDRLTRS